MKGWECPKCNAVMSPTYPTCWYCKPVPKLKDLQPGGDLKFDLPSERQQCDHDWDVSMIFTSNPPKLKCKKCGALSDTKYPDYYLKMPPFIPWSG